MHLVFMPKTVMPITAATAPRATQQQCRGQQLTATGTQQWQHNSKETLKLVQWSTIVFTTLENNLGARCTTLKYFTERRIKWNKFGMVIKVFELQMPYHNITYTQKKQVDRCKFKNRLHDVCSRLQIWD